MDISQITNYDNGTIIQHNIVIDGETHLDVDYKQFGQGGNINVYKFGYCCENRAIQYPIFLSFDGNNTFQKFAIGSTGMFEFQPETFKDADDIEAEEKQVKIKITGFQAPFYDELSEVKDPERADQGFIQKVDYAIGEPD